MVSQEKLCRPHRWSKDDHTALDVLWPAAVSAAELAELFDVNEHSVRVRASRRRLGRPKGAGGGPKWGTRSLVEVVLDPELGSKLPEPILDRALRLTEGRRKAAVLVHCSSNPDACVHDFQGWREFPDGNGGEQVCAKCGMGAMAYSLRVGP